MRLRQLPVFLLLFGLACGSPPNPPTPSRNQIPLVNGGGAYFINLWVHGQAYLSIVDTGSSNLLLQGDAKTCPACASDSSNLSSDNSYTPISKPLDNGQTYDIVYGAGSGSFKLFNDTVALVQNGPAIFYDLGVFVTGTDIGNILGLSYDGIVNGPKGYTSFWTRYRAAYNLPDVFAINLCPLTTQNSFIEFGTTDPRVTPQYTAITNHKAFYVVQPTRLIFDSSSTQAASVNFPQNTFTQNNTLINIIDSGTTQIIITSTMLSAIQSYYEGVGIPSDFWDASPSNKNQLAISSTLYAKLRSMSIQFKTADNQTISVTVPPSSYTSVYQIDRNNNPVSYVSAFSSQTVSKDSSLTVLILGNRFMQNAYVVFDRAGNQIGFADNTTLCGSAHYQSTEPLGSRQYKPPGANAQVFSPGHEAL